MTQLITLLELRAKIKSKKPNFIRQDYQRRKKLANKLRWKKPKGIHSKIRHKFKGHRKMPSPGHKSPRSVKGLHASGLRMVNVASADSLKRINKESEGIIISKAIGNKKRLEILKKAKELNINVLNLNADEHIKKIESAKIKPLATSVSPEAKEPKKEELQEKNKAGKEEAGGKEKVKKENKDVSGDAEIQLLATESVSGKVAKEKSLEKLSDEQKKEAEKREKDKVLTKKT